MRIVSLLPSATEILFGLGAGDDVVAVTFECDFPAEARSRTVVSSSSLPEGMTPREIDAFVAAAVRNGEDLYRLEADALAGLAADVVVTQDLCGVCAIDTSVVDEALAHLGCQADVVTIDPHTIEDVLTSVIDLGARTGRAVRAGEWVDALRHRLRAVARAVRDEPRPRVLVLEWTDPPYAPGHWIPGMVELAGGVAVLGTAGEPSHRVTWDAAVATEPDLVVCAPCGYTLDDALPLAEQVARRFGDLPVWAVDANASFARPGPRLVDGVETLAAIFHPAMAGAPQPGQARRVPAVQVG